MENNINLSETILTSINELINSLFSSIDTAIYSMLDNLTFIDTSILSNTYFQKILGLNSSEGILLICNSLIFGFILYYAISFLLSHLTYSSIDSPKQFIFKCILFIPIMNSSLWICEQIINLVSIITSLINSIGNTLFNKDVTFVSFIDNINMSVYMSGDLNIFSFDGIVKSFTSFGLINLIFSYSLRYIMLQIFILLSPFAFLSLISSSSKWFFQIWFKSFLSLLLVQILISLILLLSFSFPLTDSSSTQLLYIGIIYALTRANGYIKEIFGGISTSVNSNLSTFVNRRFLLRFIFPKNYTFKSKLFGFIDYSTAIINLILAVFLYFLLNLLFSNINIKIFLFISIFFPVFLISIIGLNRENFLVVFRYLFKYFLNQKIYLYKK